MTNWTLRNAGTEDVSLVRQFVDNCKPLTVHTAVTYAVLFRLFPELCFIAENEDQIVGFASAIRGTSESDAVYCWQIGVLPEFRGTGLARELVEARLAAGKTMGCKLGQVGIEPGNDISLKLWQKVAKAQGKELREAGSLSFADELTGSTEFDIIWELEL